MSLENTVSLMVAGPKNDWLCTGIFHLVRTNNIVLRICMPACVNVACSNHSASTEVYIQRQGKRLVNSD